MVSILRKTQRCSEIFTIHFLIHRKAEADTYFILKDFCSYADAQKKIDERYRDEKSWAKTVMINSFKAGKFHRTEL